MGVEAGHGEVTKLKSRKLCFVWTKLTRLWEMSWNVFIELKMGRWEFAKVRHFNCGEDHCLLQCWLPVCHIPSCPLTLGWSWLYFWFIAQAKPWSPSTSVYEVQSFKASLLRIKNDIREKTELSLCAKYEHIFFVMEVDIWRVCSPKCRKKVS